MKHSNAAPPWEWRPKAKVELDRHLISSDERISSSFTPKPHSDIHSQEENPLPPVKISASGMENYKLMPDSCQRAYNPSKQPKSVSTSYYSSKDSSHMNQITKKVKQRRVPDEYCMPIKRNLVACFPLQDGIPEKVADADRASSITPFDICPIKANSFVKVKPPLHALNREKRNQLKHSLEGPNIDILRPGMVLMNGYISFDDQVNIVKTCRELGLGDGGFYQPRYRNGAKLQLKMMCLGMNWDPQSRQYSHTRPFDNS